jgi:rhodanese-related sulfurtransferase
MIKEISPNKAFTMLKNNKLSLLIDVRTLQEWQNIGTVDDKDFCNKTLFNSWLTPPEMQINQDFIAILNDYIKQNFSNSSKSELELLFLCRSGARSLAAGNFTINNDYQNCYNITNGFEGDPNQFGARSLINGWLASKLPYTIPTS